MSDNRYLPWFQGCAAGVTLEAIGVPHETLTFEEIQRLTGGKGLSGLQPALRRSENASIRRIRLGGTSDDWQHWRAVARSLLHRNGTFDRIDVARELVLEYHRCTHGWGGSSKDAIRRISRTFDFGGIESLYPEIPPRRKKRPVPGVPLNAKGCGNGVGMKVGPLAMASLMKEHDSDPSWLWNSCRELGELTHPDPRAWIAAYALAWCIRYCLRRSKEPYSIHSAAESEWMLISLIAYLDPLEPVHDDRVTGRLKMLDKPATIKSAASLRETIGTSCYALESVPFAIGTFLRHPTDVRTGANEILNAGGDTDTNIGMYASLAGANVGINNLPADWLEQIPNSRQALALGEAMEQLVSGKTQNVHPARFI